MGYKLSILTFLTCFMFSCNKEEQSCNDGIFTPGKEEQTDCGGVCPPCDFTPTEVETYLSVQMDGEIISFDEYSLSKSPDWILSFQNDSLIFSLNFGYGDSLGGRPIQESSSNGMLNNQNYPNLEEGIIVFSEIDHEKNQLSGFFKAKFTHNSNSYDTLAISSAEFAKIEW